MSKTGLFIFCIVALWGVLAFLAPAQAQLPAAATPAVEGPLTVTDVTVDKTSMTAVTAREEAIVEARRLAFQKLAERSMTPDVFKTFVLPDDVMIATFIQDFEMKQEKISANRYVANFTVRFNAAAADHINSAGGQMSDAAPLPVAPTPTAAAPPARSILVLPYFENIAGKKVLWEDPNPWREAWQVHGNAHLPSGGTVTVPFGDISDIATGSTDIVWEGDFSAIESLRDKYSAQEVVLAVANKSGVYIYVSIYVYKDGKLERRNSLMPYTSGEDNKSIFRQAIAQVIHDIQELKPFEEAPISPADAQFHELTAPLKEVVVPSGPPVPPPVPEKITLRTTIAFSHFTQWLEVQKRLVAISPPVTIEISSLSKNAAQFTMQAELIGGVTAFTAAVAGRGMTLALAEGADPQNPTYTLKLN